MKALSNKSEVISIMRTTEDASDIYKNLKKGFELIGTPNFKRDDVVLIKPNLCCIKGPETGATTDPKVVEAIIKYLQDDFGISDISIVESDGTQLVAQMAFKLLGYEKLASKYGVKLVNLSKAPCSQKTFGDNIHLKKIKVPELVERANWFISVPKMKTHTMCTITGTLKNQYGCNPHARKIIYHERLSDCVVDLYAAFKANLVVVDGIVGMEGRGPVDGLPVQMNILMFGRDGIAVDHLMARVMGINPKQVEHIVKAQKRGLGTTTYRTVGVDPKEVERQFRETPARHNLYGIFSRQN